MKTPIIIPYKRSAGSERDIAYTLRSFDKHVEFGDLVIVGDKPEYLNPAAYHHVPFPHNYRKNKDANMLMACVKGAAYLLSRGYAGEVIVAADDCVALRPLEVGTYVEEPFVPFMEKFPERSERNKWWLRPYGSIIYCLSRGWKFHDNCETHVPQRVSVQSILSVIEAPIGEVPFSIKTLIVNCRRSFEGAVITPTKKIAPAKLTAIPLAHTEGWDWCNWSPAFADEAFYDRLLALFPEKSRFEK